MKKREPNEKLRAEITEMIEYFKSVFDESDRGAVLAVAAKLDDTLGLLHNAFISMNAQEGEKMYEELSRPFGPLSSFSGRTKIAYAYGLISNGVRLDLDKIRNLRNRAAHTSKKFSLDEVNFKDVVYNLKPLERMAVETPELFEVLTPEQRENIKTPRARRVPPKLSLILGALCLDATLLGKTVEIKMEHLVRIHRRRNSA